MSEKGVDWDFEGNRLSIKNALALCYVFGFKGGKLLRTAVCVMTAESQRYTRAWHKNTNGTIDRGLWQINSGAHALHEELAFDPRDSTEYAYHLWTVRGFQPWAAYNSGAYLKYWPAVAAVWLLGRWKSRLSFWGTQ